MYAQLQKCVLGYPGPVHNNFVSWQILGLIITYYYNNRKIIHPLSPFGWYLSGLVLGLPANIQWPVLRRITISRSVLSTRKDRFTATLSVVPCLIVELGLNCGRSWLVDDTPRLQRPIRIRYEEYNTSDVVALNLGQSLWLVQYSNNVVIWTMTSLQYFFLPKQQ